MSNESVLTKNEILDESSEFLGEELVMILDDLFHCPRCGFDITFIKSCMGMCLNCGFLDCQCCCCDMSNIAL